MSQQVIAVGRLFMTPEQRSHLEQNKTDAPIAEPTELRDQQTIHLNGFVKPKHSSSTIWVNGQVRNPSPQKNYYVRHWVSPDHQISVDLQGGRANLSPGQTLDIDNHTVTEAYLVKPQLESVTEKVEHDGIAPVLENAKTINQTITEEVENLPESSVD